MDTACGIHSLRPRPAVSRQRSNSTPAQFSLVNVTDEEASVIFSAAERATARRRRPLSLDSPGPIINSTQHRSKLPYRTFNFSTPSRFGIGKSSLRNAVTRLSVDQAVEPKQEERVEVIEQVEKDEEMASYEVEPAPIPPRQRLSPACTIPTRSPSICSNTSSQDPTSSRRRVVNDDLKAYADGLLLFTQSRLNTVAPQTPHPSAQLSDSSVPPTPELESDVVELGLQRPALRSHFSNWSSTTVETVDTPTPHFSFASSVEHSKPEEESRIISPDSFFDEATPRMRQATEWTSISSARPLSQISGSHDSQTSNSLQTANDPYSEYGSYFVGFDSVCTIVSSRNSTSSHDFELPRAPRIPSRFSSRSQSRPASPATNCTPFSRRRQHTPLGEGMGMSRPPSWLVRAVH